MATVLHTQLRLANYDTSYNVYFYILYLSASTHRKNPKVGCFKHAYLFGSQPRNLAHNCIHKEMMLQKLMGKLA